MTIRKLLPAAAIACALTWPGWASAEPFATVSDLTEPTPRGHRPVSATGEAVVIREGVEVPLAVGMELLQGDTVRTTTARVTIALSAKERLVVEEGSELVLEERGVLQQLGDVYYRVRGAFSTTYATVEATVEGTEYLVSGGDAVTVGVRRGVVRVASGGESVAVKKNQIVTVAPGETPPQPAKWPAAQKAGQLGFTWPRLSPPVTIGARVGAGLGRQGVGGVEGFARLSLPAGWRVVLDAGAEGIVGPGVAIPLGAGVGHGFGPLTLAAQLTPTLVLWDDGCARGGDLELGGAGSAALSLPLAFGLRFEAELEGGWSGGLVADAAIGLGVDL